MSYRALLSLAFIAIATLSNAATVPVLTVLSPSYAISGFTMNSDFQLTQITGSPFETPDYTSGSSGNPASVAINNYVGPPPTICTY